MKPTTKEQKIIDSVKERRKEDPIMSQGLIWILRILLPLDILMVTLVLVLLAFHVDTQYAIKANRQAQQVAIQKLVCVLRVPLEERTDENIRDCMEYRDSEP